MNESNSDLQFEITGEGFPLVFSTLGLGWLTVWKM